MKLPTPTSHKCKRYDMYVHVRSALGKRNFVCTHHHHHHHGLIVFELQFTSTLCVNVIDVKFRFKNTKMYLLLLCDHFIYIKKNCVTLQFIYVWTRAIDFQFPKNVLKTRQKTHTHTHKILLKLSTTQSFFERHQIIEFFFGKVDIPNWNFQFTQNAFIINKILDLIFNEKYESKYNFENFLFVCKN